MKHLCFLLFLIIASYNMCFSQHRICVDVIKNETGKYYILYSDNTWEESSKSTFNVFHTAKGTKINSSVIDNVNYIKSTPNTTNKTTTSASRNSSNKASSTGSSICGARTKKGASCQRRVSGGGYCYQHR